MSRAPRTGGDGFRLRALFLFGVLLLGAAGLLARAVDLQLVEYKFLVNQGDARFLRDVTTVANRGSILDRNGAPLAISTPVASVWTNPAELEAVPEQYADLAKALHRNRTELTRRISSNQARSFLWLARHLPPDDAQDGGTGTRVGGGLRLAGTTLATRQPQLRVEVRRNGQPCPGRIRLRVTPHELLDHAVFQRMEADHRKPAAGSEHLQRSCKTALQLAELVVDVHADGLEGPRGRVTPALARAHCAAHDPRELRCGGNRFEGALFDYVSGDAAGEALFTQRTDHVADLVGRGAGEPLRGADSVRRVHAHVERTVGLETEAARGFVELRRRHAEVEQNPSTGTSFAMCRDQ